MKSLSKILLLSLVIFAISSCNKDDDSGIPDPQATVSLNYPAMIIANQGNFGSANATVDFYETSNGETHKGIFSLVNSESLGDTHHSSTVIGNSVYLVVNGSGKIEVVNKQNFNSEAMINGLASPRFICEVSESKAYVSDISSAKIAILNTESNTVTGYIDFPDYYSEHMVKIGDEVFVSAPNRDKIYIINTSMETVSDSILLSEGTNSMLMDANNKLWVFCTGYWDGEQPPAVHRIDPQTREIEVSIVIEGSYIYPGAMDISANGEIVYVLAYDLYKMPVSAITFPSETFIPSDGRSFSALAVNKQNGEIALADAVDFSSNGVVYRYTSEGELVNSIEAGVIPGHILYVD